MRKDRQYFLKQKIPCPICFGNQLFGADALLCFPGFVRLLSGFKALITSGRSCEDSAEWFVKPRFCCCLNLLEMMGNILAMLKSVEVLGEVSFY